MTKTIIEKLNLTKYKQCAVLNCPAYNDQLRSISADTQLTKEQYDLIFAFALNLDELNQLIDQVLQSDKLVKTGYLYIAYPKKGNTMYPTFIHRDELLSGVGADEEGFVRASKLKFSRMVGMDEVFTVVGFKFEDKQKQKVEKQSQRVDDYTHLIPQIVSLLSNEPQALQFFNSLTPGYQKDWARYIYSSTQVQTQDKRKLEMIRLLRAGYKSFALYRKAQI